MIKSIFIRGAVGLIKATLWLLDADHRKARRISVADDKEFTDIAEIGFESDFGRGSRVFRTVPYEAWELRTETKTLVAADRHRVLRDDHSCAWIEDLVPGDLVKTDAGLERVVSARPLNVRTHMYCVEVETDDPLDPNNHLYYSDGILSHNTTCAAAYLLWKAMFVDDTTILITANKYSQALEIMDRIRYGYENLPDHIRAGVKEYNKGTIAFDNGSKIVSRATSRDAGRGLSITLLYCDEFAFVPNNISTEFWTAIQPVLATGGSCIITSTPRTDEDQFALIWKGAIDNTDEFGNPSPGSVGKNGFFAIDVPWWRHPERDEAWAKPFRESLGEARFQQEFENRFVSDEETLIDPLRLSVMQGRDPEFYTGTVRWYSDPEPNRTYVAALDPSLGTGGDFAAIEVFQLPEMIQVAEWQHNRTDTRGQVRTLMQILLLLDDELRSHPDQHGEPEIFWTIENNSIGEAILNIIEDTGEDKFPGLFVSEKKRKGQTRRFRKGMNTDARKKLSACVRLKSLIESGRMTINSKPLIREFKAFVSKETSFSAKPGEHDDLVSACLLVTRMLDIVTAWGTDMDDLKEVVEVEDLYDDDAMPVVL